MSRSIFLIIVIIIYLSIDFYLLAAFRGLVSTNFNRRVLTIVFLSFSILLLICVCLYSQIDPKQFRELRLCILTAFSIFLFGKIFAAIFLLVDDLRRLGAWTTNFFSFRETPFSQSRLDFMTKSAVVVGAIPVASMTFGIISGAHDYRVRRKKVYFKTIPTAFDGIRIAQISDIHTGSFYNQIAVQGGVDMLLQEKPDIVFFTGDLVNNQSEEAREYLDIFKKIKAPLGVFSVMGNHDYGDYKAWASKEAKLADVKNLHDMHKYMGYDLLLNENRTVKIEGQKIGVLGCENWGSGRFTKYGDLEKTAKGTESLPFKILLSHDPSHWDAQIRPTRPDIDLTLSGHTHGFQFGVEIGDFRWSPVQYRYKQWADLYRESEQYLYVNRGYGFIGYPGRIGILPEITILELRRA